MDRYSFRLGAVLTIAAAIGPARARAGDFNGDGFDDLAIGAPGETVSTASGAVFRAGAVNVIYGGSNGLNVNQVPDQTFTQESPGVPGAAEYDDQFGASVTSGDFDGDGYDDLAIGSPFEDLTLDKIAYQDMGMVTIIFGTAQGLSATARAPQTHRSATRVAGICFGQVMAAGDFSRDGRDDLAVGVPRDSVNGFFAAGTVHVFYGTATGLNPTAQVLSQGRGIGEQPEKADGFGASLATSDFNGDGAADLAIGVPSEGNTPGQFIQGRSFPGSLGYGIVHVTYGLPGIGLDGTASRIFAQGENGLQGSQGGDDQFGFSLAAMPGGRSGLAIGCPRDNDSPQASGSVTVLPPITLSPAESTVISQNIVAGFAAPTPDDRFGAALVLGDFGRSFPNGGFDLAIGAPGARSGSTTGVRGGAVIVIYGTGTSRFNLTQPQLLAQGFGGLGDVAELEDGFGSVMIAGQYGKDLLQDLVIAVPREDSGLVDTGLVHVLYGNVTQGLSTAGSQLWTQDSPGVDPEIAETGDLFGAPVSGR
ncbi:MAG: hypothetical protein U1E76_09065 [Planctomycetota bacterium]